MSGDKRRAAKIILQRNFIADCLSLFLFNIGRRAMALRRFMHPRNKYKDGADFKKLAILYPEFCKHATTELSGRLRYNFKNEESLRVLAKTLLKHDFGLEVDIPAEKLVPVMPLRLNYVLWIEDLMAHAKLRPSEICGIDIGTGAVCIYPLLCAKNYGWRMMGTEISETSIRSAIDNVKKNGLDRLIKVIHVKDETSLLKEALEDEEVHYSFTMCNPPFFDTDECDRKEKRLPPRNAASGNKSELHVAGGERLFVTRLIEESAKMKERVKIYTTMLGQKSSCAFFRSELKKRNIANATWTEFCQGHTKRWGLAWSFFPEEVVDLTNAPVMRTREQSSAAKQPNHRPSETVFPLGGKFASLDELIISLKRWIQELKIEMKELTIPEKEFNGWTCRLKAHEDSWSHARRKRRMARQSENSSKRPCLENPETERSDNDSSETQEDRTKNIESTSKPVEPLLECILMVGEFKSEDAEDEADLVKVCMIYEGGHGGKLALEAFKQYLINKLCIRDYLLSQSRGKSPKKNKRKDKRTEEPTVKD